MAAELFDCSADMRPPARLLMSYAAAVVARTFVAYTPLQQRVLIQHHTRDMKTLQHVAT